MPDIQTISPCLWFDRQADAAAQFYISIFPDAQINRITKSAVEWPNGRAGETILVEFTLAGHSFQALNGGPGMAFSEAVSLSVRCADQAEVDRYWNALIADGGEAIMCGWLKDKYGVRWQIVPDAYMKMMSDPDTDKVAQVMTAMMRMVKLDVAAFEAAFHGIGSDDRA